MDIIKLSESLSPNERKILPYLEENIIDICKKSNLDKISVLRAFEFLQNKKIIEVSYKTEKIIEIGVNGALYKKIGLPERRLLNILNEKRILKFKDAQKNSKISDEEFKASIGVLKKKAMIELKNGKIVLNADKKEIYKKTLEELFLENIPLKYDSLSPEQIYSLKSLQKRKDIIQLKEKKIIKIKLTDFGKEIVEIGVKEKGLIEQITPEMLKNEKLWKNKKFRRYDVLSNVPKINGGKRHFVNQSIDYARKIWTEMGFKEISGNLIQTSFWNFDALFTAQDHPVREMHDTFFISNIKGKLPNDKLISSIKKSHEKGITGSKGWGYLWNEEEAKKLVLRTHTTCLSAQKLAKISKQENSGKIKEKFFAIGPSFRNETVDWNHGFELLQSEGIVIDENANFKHLIGYLKQFAKKMGFEKIRFRPAYFPYTEPSLEGDVWNEEKKEWVELIAAGIFRPEVTEPLFGKPITVLAWGPGFSRMLMSIFKIKDIRELNKNNLTQLRKIKFLMK